MRFAHTACQARVTTRLARVTTRLARVTTRLGTCHDTPWHVSRHVPTRFGACHDTPLQLAGAAICDTPRIHAYAPLAHTAFRAVSRHGSTWVTRLGACHDTPPTARWRVYPCGIRRACGDMLVLARVTTRPYGSLARLSAIRRA